MASGRPTEYAGHCRPSLRASLGRIDGCSLVCRKCSRLQLSSFHLMDCFDTRSTAITAYNRLKRASEGDGAVEQQGASEYKQYEL